MAQAPRERLASERPSITKKFQITYKDEVTGEVKTLKFYILAGMYEDGRLAEVFIRGDKIGGFLGGALDTWAIMFSMAMQHGIPMDSIIEKLRWQRFGPSGTTGDPEFRSCTSMFDLIAQWLAAKFPDGRYKPPGKAEGSP